MERFESIFRCEARRMPMEPWWIVRLIRKLSKGGKELGQLQFPFNRAPVNSMDEIAEKDRVSHFVHGIDRGAIEGEL
jgi:hypothetical protein